MRKYVIAILVIVVLGVGVAVGLILVNQQQIFKQKASTPTGTATVSIQPATATFQRNTPNTISVYFNAGSISMSGLQIRLSYSNLAVKASGIQINPALLSGGDWVCPVKTIASSGSTDNIDIACANVSTAGYTNNSDTLLATFTLTATQVPIQNPVIFSFDPQLSKLTQKSDGTDILLTPASTGSYTITDTLSGSPTPSPTIIVSSPTPTPSLLALATATPTIAPTQAPGATATPTPVSTAVPTATAIATTYTPIPTAASGSATMQPIPVTGFDAPTIIGGAAGIILLLLGALVVFI